MKRDFLLFVCLSVSVFNLIVQVIKLMGNNDDSLKVSFTSESFWLPGVHHHHHHVPAPVVAVDDGDDEDADIIDLTEKSSSADWHAGSSADEEVVAVGGSGLRGSNSVVMLDHSDDGKDQKAKLIDQAITRSVLSKSESKNSPAADSPSSNKKDDDNKINNKMDTSSNINADTNKQESKKNNPSNKYSTFPPNIHFSTDIMTKKSFTSSTYLSTDLKYVLKIMDKNTPQKKKEWLTREICILKHIHDKESGGGLFDWAPKLVWYNESAMLTTYMGRGMDVYNIPLDYKEQYKQILSDMESIGVEHGDIHKSFGYPKELYELMVRDNDRLSLVDFGLAKLHGSFDCNGQVVSNVSKAYNFEPDRWVLKKLDRTFKRHLKLEQHFVVDWTQHYSQDEISKTIMAKWPNLVIRKMATHPAYMDDTERKDVFLKFYGGPTDDFRGKQPFNMYFIYDTDPTYDLRPTNKGKRLVNAAMFDLKKALRKKMGGGYKIHGTDNIQETKDNMVALDQPGEYRQRRFNTLKQVFDVLNLSQMPYVVLRNYENMPEDVPTDVNPLVLDLLVSDYYEIKRIVDGDSPNKFFKEHYENGYHRIVNDIYIKGKERVVLHPRSIGDTYLDEQWQRDILERRVKFNGIYVPSEQDHLHALIHHAIISRPKIPETHVKVFKDIGKFTEEQARDKVFLRSKLDVYMKEHGYKLVKPRDLSVAYNPGAGKKKSV